VLGSRNRRDLSRGVLQLACRWRHRHASCERRRVVERLQIVQVVAVVAVVIVAFVGLELVVVVRVVVLGQLVVVVLSVVLVLLVQFAVKLVDVVLLFIRLVAVLRRQADVPFVVLVNRCRDDVVRIFVRAVPVAIRHDRHREPSEHD